ASSLLEYENGAWGYYYTTTNEVPAISYLEIAGDKGKIIYNGASLRFFATKQPISQFTFNNKSMWASVETKEKALRIPKKEASHGAIIKNFCRAIIKGETLVSPGIEGINSVEFINAILLSGYKGKPVETPVDRDEYDAFLQDMIKKSKDKTTVRVQIQTDPNLKK
ncbi:MAG TPA: Gfo/Idh/MocA family oxidoreductase, partial [bacterium]|nr:Gfo/Idh/MocA family oxidoreductase [bacterium]